MNWISVKDKLPEVDGRYLVLMNRSLYLKGSGIRVGDPPFINSIEIFRYHTTPKAAGHIVPSWDAKGFGGDLTKYITHWMPLPEPPKP